MSGLRQWGRLEFMDPHSTILDNQIPGSGDFSEDTALVEALARGDRDAEDVFVRRFLSRARALFLARTRNVDLAADLAQEAILESLCALRRGQLREPSKLAAFVLGVARNILFQHLRGSMRDLAKDELPDEVPAALQPDPLVEAERQQMAAKAIGSLDPIDRQILQMTLIEDLKPGVIALKLNLSSDVVRQRKTRATRRVTEIVRQLSQSPAGGHTLTGK